LTWWLAGLVLGVLFVALASTEDRAAPSLTMLLTLLVGWSFVGCGVYASSRRPDNPLGRLMVVVGLVWLLSRALLAVDSAWLFTVGVWLGDAWAVALVAFLLAFPNGRLRGRSDATILSLFIVVAVPLELAWLLVWPGDGPGNALAVWPDADLAGHVDTVQRSLSIVAALLLAASLLRRWHRSSAPMRRASTPILAGAAGVLLSSSLTLFVKLGIDVDPLVWAVLIAYIAIPIAVLGVIVRARIARGAVADLVVELGNLPAPDRLRDSLAHALGDPALAVAYWSPAGGSFVGRDGAPFVAPAEDSGLALTVLERDGAPLAAIVHDAALLDDPALVTSVASAVRLAVENERLTAAVEAQLDEVRASRARIVSAADEERKRVERDLHDGAQQRLVSLSLALRMVRTRLGPDVDPSIRLSLEQASEEAKAALGELRELARGIHPQILTEAGLGPAVESLADRSPVEVSVEIDPDRRFSPAVEGTAYFVVSEALANIAKYAHASHATVRARYALERLTVEVIDDGVGGAGTESGTGLRGLADRLAAIDGTLEVDSPHGHGTRLIADMPTGLSVGMPG
jgi:signal transduction histidine kinase